MTTRVRCAITLAACLGATAGALHAFVPFSPPACSGALSDVAGQPCSWAEQLVADGITAACAAGKYCPDNPVTRVQLAAMLERAMRGTSTWAPWQGVFKRIVLVQPVPGDDAASGIALADAIAGITDSGPSNPYLVKLEPGIYALPGQLTLPVWVALEGSGQDITVIRGDGGSPQSAAAPTAGVVNGGREIRDLSVIAESSAGQPFNTAVHQCARLDHVTLQATSTSGQDVGYFGQGKLNAVNATADEAFFFWGGSATASTAIGGVEIQTATVSLDDVSISSFLFVGSGGVVARDSQVGGTVTINGTARFDHCDLLGALNGGSFKISDSLVSGSVAGASPITCVGAFNAAYASLGGGCT